MTQAGPHCVPAPACSSPESADAPAAPEVAPPPPPVTNQPAAAVEQPKTLPLVETAIPLHESTAIAGTAKVGVATVKNAAPAPVGIAAVKEPQAVPVEPPQAATTETTQESAAAAPEKTPEVVESNDPAPHDTTTNDNRKADEVSSSPTRELPEETLELEDEDKSNTSAPAPPVAKLIKEEPHPLEVDELELKRVVAPPSTDSKPEELDDRAPSDEHSDPCTRPVTTENSPEKDHELRIMPSGSGYPDDVPAPIADADSLPTKPESINLERADQSDEEPQPAAEPEDAAPEKFEPDSAARAIEPAAPQPQPAAAAPAAPAADPYQYSYPGPPGPKSGRARTRPGTRNNIAPKPTPQFHPDSKNLGELYRPHYKNGFMNQFRYGW
ncbi:MAG: hypothetical protein AB7O26_03805 [Planctomycetaceae bacterium]